MAIRIEHQPSPAVVGMAAYATGRGKYRQRQKYQAARGAAIQRDPFGGQAAGQQAAGEWIDPLAAAQTPADRMMIKAQRRENARAQRMGKGVVHPGVDPFFKPAPTKEEIRRKQELEDRDWEVKHEAEINEREKQEAAARAKQQHEWGLEKEGRESRKKKVTGLVGSLTTIPDEASWEDKRELGRQLAAIKKRAEMVDFNDNKQIEQLEEAIDIYEEAIENLEPSKEVVEKAAREKIEYEQRQTEFKMKQAEEERKKDKAAWETFSNMYPNGVESFVGGRKAAMEEWKRIRGEMSGGGGAEGGELPEAPAEVVTKDGVQYQDQPGKGYVQVPSAAAPMVFDPATGNLRPSAAAPPAAGESQMPQPPALVPPNALAPGAAERRKPRLPEEAGAVAPPEVQAAPPPEEAAVAAWEWVPPVVLGARSSGTRPPRPGRPGYKTWKKKVDAEYEQLPSGAAFVGPDGKKRRKP